VSTANKVEKKWRGNKIWREIGTVRRTDAFSLGGEFTWKKDLCADGFSGGKSTQVAGRYIPECGNCKQP
jgi:hypothetical protein